jgi:hypothetical protein
LAAVQRVVATRPHRVLLREAFTTEVLGELLDLAYADARRHVLDVLAQLTAAEYAHTRTAQAPPADVYGWRDGRGRGWYIKFTVLADGRPYVVSFHPPEAPLRTRSGVVTR